MSLSVHVQGGTVARRRDFRGQPKEWQCDCFEIGCCGNYEHGECCNEPEPVGYAWQPGYLRRCPGCGAERPA